MTEDLDDGLYFLPLGGSEEIGMNFYLYGTDGKWLIVDCGITFGDDLTPGIDILMADPSFIEERREDIVGLVLTHAHEDHFGAIPYLWPRLRCPIYASKFSAALLRLKLAESDFADAVQIIDVEPAAVIDLGPFQVRFIGMTHSIPEASALVIGTRFGTVVHSGDWKLDPDPMLGAPSDEEALAEVGRKGVDALVCDSTNALEPGVSGSEATVRSSLTELIKSTSGRIVVTCFSTNVARLVGIAHAAHAAGRDCALVGRALWRVHAAAVATGYMDTLERPFLTDREASDLPRDGVVLVCTGSQGEPRSALSRMAADDHPVLSLDAGDTVVFSAREIPGNEKAILRVQNGLVARGVHLITANENPGIHVSGHPARDELVRYYQWVRPKTAVPVHGEARHILAHAQIARDCQVPNVVLPRDGALIRLAPGPAEIVDHVPATRLALDGDRLMPLDSVGVRSRRQIMFNGAVVITLVVDRAGQIVGDPQVTPLGLDDGGSEEEEGLLEAIAGDVDQAIAKLTVAQRRDDDIVREAARTAARRAAREVTGKRPPTTVHLVRV